MQSPPLRILCADDNVHVLSMLSSRFNAKGFEVEAVVDGAQALKRISAAPSHFDLLITDSRMPELDGFGLVQQARTAGYEGRVVVFASALCAADERRYRALGANDVIKKPDGASDLFRCVDQMRSS